MMSCNYPADIVNMSCGCKVTGALIYNLLDFINNPLGIFDTDQYPGYEAMDKENSDPDEWTEEEFEQRAMKLVGANCFSMKNKEHVEQAIKTLQECLNDPTQNGDCLIYFKYPAV